MNQGKDGMRWRCDGCGHIQAGKAPPAACPTCAGSGTFKPLPGIRRVAGKGGMGGLTRASDTPIQGVQRGLEEWSA